MAVDAGQIKITISSDTTKLDEGLNKAKKGISQFSDTATGKARGATKTLSSAMSGLGRMAGILGLSFGAAGVVGFLRKSVDEFRENERAVTRLEHILRTAVGATDEHIASLKSQAQALEKVGVVGEEAILIAQGQFASFDLQAESIEKLIPSLLDYAVAEDGASVSAESLQNKANGLGKALQGQTDMLVKSGFKFTEQQMHLLKTGDETERVSALSDILNSTYKGLNEQMRNTSEGGAFALKVSLGDLRKEIGERLSPIIGDLSQKMSEAITKFLEFTDTTRDYTNKALDENKDKVDEVRGKLGDFKTDLESLTGSAVGVANAQEIWNRYLGFTLKTSEGIINYYSNMLGLLEKITRIIREHSLPSVVKNIATNAGNFFSTGFEKRESGFDQKASGGYVSGGLTMVGEQGAELVNLPRGSRVYNHEDTKMMSGGVNINNPIFNTPFDLKLAMRTALNEAQLRGL